LRRAEVRCNGSDEGGTGRAYVATDDPIDLIALDAALEELSKTSERQAKTAELRYFGGVGVKETAEVWGVSGVTVKRDWHYAKAWLYREIEADQGTGPRRADGQEPAVS
jgi:DNA-directed RNA polymerase specialized sigma24 family protein